MMTMMFSRDGSIIRIRIGRCFLKGQFLPCGRLRDIKRPAQHSGRVAENSILGAAEDDADDFASVGTAAGDEAMLGLVGIAGLHAITEPVISHRLIGIA